MAASGLRQLTEREQAIVGKYATQHGTVRAFDAPIAAEDGSIAMPLLRLPLLMRLEHRGTITTEQAAAGEYFHMLFQHAALDGLRTADLARVPGGTIQGDISPSNERCRRRIAEAVAALGGNGSVAASAIWHIAGLEWTVRRWAISARRPNDQACGILIGALAVLASHFASGRRPPGGAKRRVHRAP
jgi:Domain of unknown function (DUF6456)